MVNMLVNLSIGHPSLTPKGFLRDSPGDRHVADLQQWSLLILETGLRSEAIARPRVVISVPSWTR